MVLGRAGRTNDDLLPQTLGGRKDATASSGSSQRAASRPIALDSHPDVQRKFCGAGPSFCGTGLSPAAKETRRRSCSRSEGRSPTLGNSATNEGLNPRKRIRGSAIVSFVSAIGGRRPNPKIEGLAPLPVWRFVHRSHTHRWPHPYQGLASDRPARRA